MLAGRVALVTGGSRGIGSAIAERLARDGADVALTFRHAEDRAREVVQRIRQSGRRGLAIRADSGAAADVVTAVERTVAELGCIAILVSTTPGSSPRARSTRSAPPTWTARSPSTSAPSCWPPRRR